MPSTLPPLPDNVRKAAIAVFLAVAVLATALAGWFTLKDDDISSPPGTVTATMAPGSVPGSVPGTSAPTTAATTTTSTSTSTSTTSSTSTTTTTTLPVPAGCPLTIAGKACWQSRTGPSDPTVLVKRTGTMKITAAGVTLTSGSTTTTLSALPVVENVDLTGCIEVYVSNAAIRNTKVTGGGCKGGDRRTAGSAIDTGTNATTVTGLTITDVEVDGQNDGHAGIGTSGYTCLRCEVHGYVDGIWMSVGASFIDSMIYSPCACGTTPHYDGIQGDSAFHARVLHSWIAMANQTSVNAAVFFADSYGPGADYVLADSFVAGGDGAGFAGGNINNPPHKNVACVAPFIPECQEGATNAQTVVRVAFSNQTGNGGTKFTTGRLDGAPGFVWSGNYVAETGKAL